MKRYSYLTSILIGALVLLSFQVTSVQHAFYNFSAANAKIILPSILDEISGLTDLGPTTIACVQDEHGIVFVYDFVQKKITEKVQFAEDGDYEGITRVANTIYVLRSDGVLFEITRVRKGEVDVVRHVTGIDAKDNEGLCYDKQKNRLLIGSKSKSGKGKEFQDSRTIHSFDLKTKKRDEKGSFDLQKQDVIKFAERNNIALPSKIIKNTGRQVIDFKMGVSGVGIHPITNDFYVLCATDYMMLIYNKELVLKGIHKLDPKNFPQAEGITFFDNGDLFISNEGKGKQPTLLRFNYK